MRVVCDYRGWRKIFDVSNNVILAGYFDMFDPFKEEESILIDRSSMTMPVNIDIKVFRFVDGKKRVDGIPVFEYYD